MNNFGCNNTAYENFHLIIFLKFRFYLIPFLPDVIILYYRSSMWWWKHLFVILPLGRLFNQFETVCLLIAKSITLLNIYYVASLKIMKRLTTLIANLTIPSTSISNRRRRSLPSKAKLTLLVRKKLRAHMRIMQISKFQNFEKKNLMTNRQFNEPI